MPAIRVDPHVATPEGVVRVRVTQRRRVNDRWALLANTDEEQGLPAVEHDEPGDELAFDGTQRQGRLRSNGFGDDARRAFDPGRNSRPAPIERGHERIADDAAQTPEGHRVSAMAATSMPATAPARPLRAASFENTRENQDGAGMSDMIMNLLKDEGPSRFLFPKVARICAPRLSSSMLYAMRPFPPTVLALAPPAGHRRQSQDDNSRTGPPPHASRHTCSTVSGLSSTRATRYHKQKGPTDRAPYEGRVFNSRRCQLRGQDSRRQTL
jgi:hypothetical protein